MKKERFILLLACALLCIQGLLAQGSHSVTLSSNQPPELFAHAGSDTTLFSAGTYLLGGLPAAEGGTPPYTFQWIPGQGLDSVTVANPTLTHTGDVASVAFHLLVTDSRHCNASDSVTIILGYHSIEELSGAGMRLYPVPATSYMTLEVPVPEGEITLKTIDGRVLQNQAIHQTTHHLAVEHLPRGIYLLTWQHGETRQTVRIVLQ